MNTIFTKDFAGSKIRVIQEFAASVELTWRAWTEKELLDQWWAPKPWRAETKFMDFREGGYWLYCMVGPDGERNWARADYKTVVVLKYYTASDSFCDENGTRNSTVPSMNWQVEFYQAQEHTTVQVEITFTNEQDMRMIIEMGLEEGFKMALGNLDELLETMK